MPVCDRRADGRTDEHTTISIYVPASGPPIKPFIFYFSLFYILCAVVSAGYPALLSSSYFERINDDDDDDDDDDDKCLRDYDLVVAHC